MSDVWVFPPEVNWQADFIKHIVIKNIRLRDENARLKEENERLYLLYQEAVEIIESAMDERCSWCMGKDGKHEPDCEANNWLMSSPNKTQEVKE